jgi:hypothetical protein
MDAVEKIDDQADHEKWDHEWFGHGGYLMHWHLAHIVWEDENFDDGCIDFCIKKIDDGKYDECTPGEAQIVRDSLVALKATPIEWRTEPDDYDGEHPENYPPPWLDEVKK